MSKIHCWCAWGAHSCMQLFLLCLSCFWTSASSAGSRQPWSRWQLPRSLGGRHCHWKPTSELFHSQRDRYRWQCSRRHLWYVMSFLHNSEGETVDYWCCRKNSVVQVVLLSSAHFTAFLLFMASFSVFFAASSCLMMMLIKNLVSSACEKPVCGLKCLKHCWLLHWIEKIYVSPSLWVI